MKLIDLVRLAFPKPIFDARLPDPPPMDAWGRHLWETDPWDYGMRGVFQIPEHGLGNVRGDNAAKRKWLSEHFPSDG